jgi:hypothetical protein
MSSGNSLGYSSIRQDVFAPVALSHVCTHVADLAAARIDSHTSIELNTSAQPNSYPHLGTVTTLFCVFALAEHLQDRTGLRTNVVFDYLENARGLLVEVEGKTFQLALSSVREAGVPKYLTYLAEFERLLRFASVRSGVAYELRSYERFQANPFIRDLLLQCVVREAELRTQLAPGSKHVHVRFPCPECELVEKSCDSLEIESTSADEVVLSMRCPTHRKHSRTLSRTGQDFFDTGTSVRDVVKIAALGVQAQQRNALSVMLDGADWAGAWAWNISARGACMLGRTFDQLPVRYFSPAILDASGSKFSKSVFVSSETYSYLPTEFLDSSLMHQIHGDSVFEKIWRETRGWVSSPARFFRNYSIEYVNRVILGEA